MKDLDIGRLETLDEVGSRRFVIPAEVSGRFHKWRSQFHLILLAIFVLIPWTTWNGKQTIWLNIPKREFILFGLTLSAQDAPMIFMLLIGATLSLAFVTSVFGRIWCGWACPQTVFIEALYRRIERWVEGDYKKRRALRDQEVNLKKFFKITLKWFLFAFVSSLIAHSFAAYFAGKEPLLEMMSRNPSDNLNYFILISGITGLLLFDFGWFREQFCIIACPYGRIQSVLMDKNSLTVMYDNTRGEPRKGATIVAGQKQGDCVSCLRCVQVCPTNIDIRNGLQMECIGCTACIDACDEIMEKVKKPKGLIGYKRLSGEPFRFLRPRPLLYLLGVLIAIVVLVWNLSHREVLDVMLTRAHEAPYQVIKNEDGSSQITNHFRLKLYNQGDDFTDLKVVSKTEKVQVITAQSEWKLKPGERMTLDVFLRFPLLPESERLALLELQIQSTDHPPAFKQLRLELLTPFDK